jgi:hypothetical protein
LGIKIIFIQSKDCTEDVIEIPGADIIIKRISSILQFTASDGFRASFDILSAAECTDLRCLFEFVNKTYRTDISMWIETRLRILTRFINGDKVAIPLCLRNEDEIIKRILIGILYVLRSRIKAPVVVDDLLSFITNELYSEAFVAMMRPYLFSINRNLNNHEMLMYNPIIIAPGGQGGYYRLAEPHKYVILFDSNKWSIPRKDIEKIARS